MSSGMYVFFIHMAIGLSSPKSKSMPWSCGMERRNISPFARSCMVRATSTLNS